MQEIKHSSKKNTITLFFTKHLRSLHTEPEIFACVFPFFYIPHSFLSKCMLRMQKRRKSKLIWIFYDGRKFRRQCVNVIETWCHIYFLTCKNFGQKFGQPVLTVYFLIDQTYGFFSSKWPDISKIKLQYYAFKSISGTILSSWQIKVCQCLWQKSLSVFRERR